MTVGFEESPAIISEHRDPQVSPQEFDCGCVTACHATDRDFLRGEKPFEMRLVRYCGTLACVVAGHLNATGARDLAVAIVDRKYGYTCEFSGSPSAHAEEYDEVETFLLGGGLCL